MTIFLGDHHADAGLDQVLAGTGHEVSSFEDGLDLYYAILAEPPDLIVLELMLPSLDGFVLSRLVHFDSRLARVPIVCLSWLEQPDLEERLGRLGCRHLVQRPFDPAKLLKLVQDLLEQPALA
ncbi:MAG: response regulator [Candidatus Eremiobacteraeota bacterium]|nr:response regulator [Candidatus Eremiobacteraeota bacterium]